MRRFIIPILGLAVAAAGLFGYWAGNRETVRLHQENLRLIQNNRSLRLQAKTFGSSRTTAALFFLKPSASNFRLQPYVCRLRGKTDPHVEALEALFAGPPSGSKMLAIFPRETKVLGFSLRNGLATVNLSQKATEINVGAQGEALAVAALVNTLAKFPDVYRVSILVEGNVTESLAGHVDLTQEFEYNGQVVEPRY